MHVVMYTGTYRLRICMHDINMFRHMYVRLPLHRWQIKVSIARDDQHFLSTDIYSLCTMHPMIMVQEHLQCHSERHMCASQKRSRPRPCDIEQLDCMPDVCECAAGKLACTLFASFYGLT